MVQGWLAKSAVHRQFPRVVRDEICALLILALEKAGQPRYLGSLFYLLPLEMLFKIVEFIATPHVREYSRPVVPRVVVTGLKYPSLVIPSLDAFIVSDERGLHLFSHTGDQLSSVSGTGFRSAAALPSGGVACYDTELLTIRVFDASLNEVGAFGKWGSKAGEFRSVPSIASDEDGNVYVAENYDHRVQVFSSGGVPLRSFTSRAGKDFVPWKVATTSAGHVLMWDGERVALLELLPDGSVLRSRNTSSQVRVDGIAEDAAGNLVFTEAGKDRVVVEDAAGNTVWELRGRGSGPGSFKRPSDVAVLWDGTLAVADKDNHRIQLI